MKKILKIAGIFTFACFFAWGNLLPAEAATEQKIKPGIYIGDVEVGGMTVSQAEEAVKEYVDSIGSKELTLVTANNGKVKATAHDFGITWVNTDIVREAVKIGQEGNVITRYKIMKDLENENLHMDLELSYDINAISTFLNEEGTAFDTKAVNASLNREDGEFVVQGGENGYFLDVEKSIDAVSEFLLTEWTYEPASISLVINEEKALGSATQLAQVQDILGTFTTSYSTSTKSRSANVENGCKLISGITLYPGEEFSTLKEITPFTTQNGYYMAASYLNGKVVDSLGGGICQVSTTLYNAVLLAELEVTERYNHSMIVAYVDPSADAAIAESAGKDFKFVNNTEFPIYIEGICNNKKITVNIYGKETRDENREVIYRSEVTSRTDPGPDVIYADPSQPIGYIVKESAHVGYKAKLWKIVKENGVEVEKTQVNSSSYKMTPRYATVGVATADPNAYNEIMAAIGTANINHVQNIIAILTAPPTPSQ